MGVHGLWQLIEPSGKPVPLETLESKVLAVDVSIWLHQAVKGFQDSKGAPVPHAHLLGIYHRVCKLLYFKVKPVFIFDGGVPVLKKQTIAKRNQLKSKNISEAERLQKQLISTLLKHSAVSKILSEKTKASLIVPPKKTGKHENIYIYALPPTELDSTISSSEDDDTEDTDTSPTRHYDLHTIDMASTHFKSLPVDVRHEILTDLKETRKQNSWGRLHELPKQSDEFSGYQMNRLLKRQAVQAALEDAEKEMGGHSLSLAEIESILKDHGVVTTNDVGKRIASDENTRYLLIKDVKQALDEARIKQQKLEVLQDDGVSKEMKDIEETTVQCKNKADKEFEDNLQKAIALSLEEKPSTSKIDVSTSVEGAQKPAYSFLEKFNDADFQSDSSEEFEERCTKKTLSSAQNYMIEYSGLTPSEIAKIIDGKNKKVKKIMRNGVEDNKINITDNGDLEESKKETIKLRIVSEENRIHVISDSESNDIPVSDVNSNKDELKKDKLESELITSEFAEKLATENDVQGEENMPILQDRPIKVIDKVITDNENIDSGKNDKENMDTIEIMSDSGDSSSSIEFLEVSKANINEDDKKRPLEILIDPQMKLEDDLFSDIFENEKVKEKSETNTNKGDKEGAEVPKSETDTKKGEKETEVPKNKVELEVPKICEKVKEKSGGVQVSRKKENTEVKEKIEEIQKLKLNVEEMQDLKNNLQKEKIDLMVERSTRERMATNITDQMYQEAQELLELFGVPYIVAPMEAEAQCAFLDTIELTDGTITDDSDIWLFGGRTVYKNFFNQNKYVMEFKAENIKHHFKLTREQMILLALLVGSDYTTGVQGIGPVTALEILAAFPPCKAKEFTISNAELLSGLKEFQSWIKKGRTAGPGRSALKNKLKNVSITDAFPSLQVVQAYMEPTVDTNREEFSWGKPDFEGLTDFARRRFGWSEKKTEEILKPVIKRMQEKRTQASIKDYFKTTHKVLSPDAKNKMSKRVKTAIDRIGKTPEELMAEEMEILAKAQQKKTNKPQTKNSRKNSVRKKIFLENEDENEAKRKQRKTRIKKKSTDDSVEMLASKIREERQLSDSKKPGDEESMLEENVPIENDKVATGTGLERDQNEESEDEFKKFADIAEELKKRRQKRNELPKKANPVFRKKQMKPQVAKKLPQSLPKDLETNLDQTTVSQSVKELKSARDLIVQTPLETIPEGLEGDKEIQVLQATTSRSLKRVEEINREVKNELGQEAKKKCLLTFHKREVIHQRLRDKSDVLRNKMKAIEMFRKSKKGPGYVEKRKRGLKVLKEDAELSENSSDE